MAGTLRKLRDGWAVARVKYFADRRTAIRYARRLGVDIADDAIIHITKWGSEPWLVSVGSGSEITDGVRLITHDGAHLMLRRANVGLSAPNSTNRYGRIAIGRNCFIGMAAIILPNVRIGDDCIVGAGAVVARSVPPRTVVAGNPARPIMSIERYAEKVRRETLALPDEWSSDAEWRRVVAATVPPAEDADLLDVTPGSAHGGGD